MRGSQGVMGGLSAWRSQDLWVMMSQGSLAPRSTSQMAESSGVPRPGVKKLLRKAREQINTLDFADGVIFCHNCYS